MGKIKIRTGRGTGTIEVDSDATKWSGEEFKKIQGRGTGRRKLSDTPEPKTRPEYKGRISSGRGTGSRKK